jgi:hypothetical protein
MEVTVEVTDYGPVIDAMEGSDERDKLIAAIDDNANTIETYLKEFVKDISRYLEREGYDSIEGATSEEAVADNITANNYLFTAGGSRRVTLNE